MNEAPEAWIGLITRREDWIAERELAHFRTTFGDLLAEGSVPPGFHWTLTPDMAPASQLGRDGHPRPGIFVPKLPLPRRMWAGGELEFGTPLRPGNRVERESQVEKIAFKEGASGPLGFVAIRHVWTVGGRTAIRERQDLVYREDPKPGSGAAPPLAEDWTPDASSPFKPDSVLLFRYSALTFNGHRIHYDQPYATGVEGYAGLVVHGPMQATLMLNLAAKMLDRLPARFAYRGLSPLTLGPEAIIEGRWREGVIDLRIRVAGGPVTMSAAATP
jgi:3-methylfumaryl-CoA hydratase